LVTNVSRIFSIPLKDSVSAIISWFNTKYEKNLNLDNFEWMNHDGEFDVEEEDF
jgi:hypothetical protein